MEHKKSIHAVLAAHKPALRNLTEMHFTLQNKTQEGYLQSISQNMLAYLRKELNNYAITAHYSIDDSVQEKRPYTAEERYRAMIELNPLLDKLRRALDADIE
jgi:DNA polymerase-3 subunit gamma/tau